MVDAARNLKNKNIYNIKIVLIGDGQLKPEIISIIKKEKLINLIHFNLMPKERLVPFIQNANVSFVPLSPNPILDTSSPNKFFESLAAGVPVIQTTKGWIKDYIEINNVGFNLEGSDSESLSELLIKLKNNPKILDNMKQNSRKCAVRDFDQIALSDLYLSSLLKLQTNKQ